MPEQDLWATEMVETLRGLAGDWDDRRGEEFDCLSSDERAAIQRKRRELLSTLGRFVIKAILDHKWQIHPRALELEDQAEAARYSERTKPYQNAAITFLGGFVSWCREHPALLSANTPWFPALNSQHADFRTEDVTREDFKRICEVIAFLLSQTKAQKAEVVLTDPIPVVRIVEVVGRQAGRSDKLAAKMKRRNYPITIVADKNYCQRADAIAMFPRYRQRIEEI